MEAEIRAEIREQLLRGDTQIEYEYFTATPSEDADRSGWNLVDGWDNELGEVFWNDNGYVVFHMDADYIFSDVLRDIADFVDIVEAVAKEQEKAAEASANPALMN